MKNYITIIAVFLLALGLCLIGLYNGIIPKKKRHINEYAYIVELDSATTEMHLDRIIDGWYIDEKDPFKNLRYRNKGAMYYVTDWQGNNVAVVNNNGLVTQRTIYYPISQYSFCGGFNL